MVIRLTSGETRRLGLDFDAVLVFWPSLRTSARRALAAMRVDPDAVELANAVQLASGERGRGGDICRLPICQL